VATALYGRVGWIGPALLFSFYGLLGLAAAVLTRDTWGPTEREQVALLEREIRHEREMGRSVVAAGASWAHRDDISQATRGGRAER
jgi:hypothetical protein